MKTCSICEESKSINEFYSNGKYNGKPKFKPFCKPCEMYYDKLTTYKLIEKAYGKPLSCEICGYDKNLSALDFHHKDPSTKEHGFNMKNMSYEKIKKEIIKCTLLCSNCHRELHNLRWDKLNLVGLGKIRTPDNTVMSCAP